MKKTKTHTCVIPVPAWGQGQLWITSEIHPGVWEVLDTQSLSIQPSKELCVVSQCLHTPQSLCETSP